MIAKNFSLKPNVELCLC